MTRGAAVVLGVDLREAAVRTNSQGAPEFYRRSLGVPWLVGLLVVPLLMAIIGYCALDRPPSASGPSGKVPMLAPTAGSGAPTFSLAPLSISRSGNNVTLSGDFPDNSAKSALVNALNGALAPGTNIVDQIQINPNIDALDFSNAAPIFKDGASITDFDLTVSGNTITLAGTAKSQVQKNAIDADAKRVWSNLNVVDNMAATAPMPPLAAAVTGPCNDLQTTINTATGGPVTFGNDGVSLTPTDEQTLSAVADKLKACPNAHATLNGYTDNAGTEATNVSLSVQRAQTVANFLIAHGVAGDHLVVRGLGSVNPVTSNDTGDGRAKNRRVEIIAS